MVRKIVERVSDEELQRDLEKYRRRAIELGATDAKIITSDMVLIDERVRAKCLYPKCGMYGTNANCPPYAMDLGLVRKIVSNFQYAIFTELVVPTEEILNHLVRHKGLTARSLVDNYEIVSKIEAEAFSDGYYFALGFAGGPCKLAFCPNAECSALLPGQPCRHPLRGRSSMEAVGMDAYAMATKVGWDIYPIGTAMPACQVPHGMRLGLVFIY